MEIISVFYVDFNGDSCKKDYIITDYYAIPSILKAIANYFAKQIAGFKCLICSKYGCKQFVVDIDYKSIECHSFAELPYKPNYGVVVFVPLLVSNSNSK